MPRVFLDARVSPDAARISGCRAILFIPRFFLDAARFSSPRVFPDAARFSSYRASFLMPRVAPDTAHILDAARFP
ncbi:hypothetical protein [Pseudoduganella lurida]|uniref:hypothetical protein n=1 Tax=Pseudoduganella lurida TaxID=1036180 RepID=UPI00119DAC5B|nr:hypothetical protein [Pseudoduganella lurida]